MRRNTGRRFARLTAMVAIALAVMSALALAAGAAGKTADQVDTTKDAKVGTILVAGDSTVYTLKGKSCTGACLKAWPPVVLPDGTTAATAGDGVDDAKLGTKELADGSLQVTYGGKPLYWYAKDKAPGQVKGNTSDKFGKWSTVAVAASSSSGSGDSGGSGGNSPSTGGAAF